MKQKVYPWLIVVAWAFISAGSIELILIGGSNFFKAVSDGIGSPVSAIALMMTVCTITLTFAAPIAGRLFPKIDSRILLTAMAVIVIVGYAQLSFGQASWQWWLAGLLYGVGGSGIFIIGAPIFIANWFQKRTGFAVGMYGMLLAILSAILNPVIAAVITAVGWRTAYLVLAIVAAVMILPWTLLVVRFKPEQLGLKPYGYVEGETVAAENQEETGPGVPYKKALLCVRCCSHRRWCHVQHGRFQEQLVEHRAVRSVGLCCASWSRLGFDVRRYHDLVHHSCQILHAGYRLGHRQDRGY